MSQCVRITNVVCQGGGAIAVRSIGSDGSVKSQRFVDPGKTLELTMGHDDVAMIVRVNKSRPKPSEAHHDSN